MHSWMRDGFYGGLAVSLLTAMFLLWLWQPEHQIRLHNDHLMRAIEHKNWGSFESFIGLDYHDQWEQDRALLLQRARAIFSYLRDVRITASNVSIEIDQPRGVWRGKILLESDQGELAILVKERVNSLTAPFELEWRRLSWKPWDWKLLRVSQPNLEIPADFP